MLPSIRRIRVDGGIFLFRERGCLGLASTLPVTF